MSRGPGALQRDLLEVLHSVGGRMRWQELAARFPEVDRSNLRRSVRSLQRMGYVGEVGIGPFRRIWTTPPPIRLDARRPFGNDELDKLLRLLPRQQRRSVVAEIAKKESTKGHR